jgi:hypothetical protein
MTLGPGGEACACATTDGMPRDIAPILDALDRAADAVRDNAGVVEPGTYPQLLSDSVHVGSADGRVVAILYTVDAGDSVEFCGLLTDTPDQDVEVLFGVAEGTTWWDTRWRRGRNGWEFLYAEHLAGV